MLRGRYLVLPPAWEYVYAALGKLQRCSVMRVVHRSLSIEKTRPGDHPGRVLFSSERHGV